MNGVVYIIECNAEWNETGYELRSMANKNGMVWSNEGDGMSGWVIWYEEWKGMEWNGMEWYVWK